MKKTKKMGFWTKATLIGGAGVLCVVTGGVAAPAIAAAIGTTGLLGAASTGTAIVTLHGCALTSASLAAIGGSVSSGVTAIAATTGAVGAIGTGTACKMYEKSKSK